MPLEKGCVYGKIGRPRFRFNYGPCNPWFGLSNETKSLKARVSLAADDDVVVDDDARGRPASMMRRVMSMSALDGVGSPEEVIVDEHDGGGRKLERTLHLPHIDGRMVDRPLSLHLVGNEPVFLSRNKTRNCSRCS